MPQLMQAWHAAEPNSCTAWRASRGPIAAAALAFKRIGWRWEAPFTMINDFEQTVNITDMAPALMGTLLHEACIRSLERRMMTKFQDTIPLNEGFEHHEYQGRRVCVDAICSYLASGRNSAIDKVYARCLATDGYWTMDRFCKAGYHVSPLCPKCKAAPDTVHHRLWKCLDPEVVKVRELHIQPAFIQAAQQAPDWSLTFTRGLFVHPDDMAVRPSSVLDVVITDGNGVRIDAADLRLEGDIYWDGSCDRCNIKSFNRAAWAVVALQDGDDEVAVNISGIVPVPYAQTPQAAEFMGYDVGVELTAGCAQSAPVMGICPGRECSWPTSAMREAWPLMPLPEYR